MDRIVIYTDGSSRGNPGPGGYGIILVHEKSQTKKEVSEGFRRTTNNRMELLAVIVGLEKLKRPCEVLVVSDSKYVVDAVEKRWVFSWVSKGFQGKKNADLWQRFLTVYRKHKVRFQWVKGHNNHPMNEHCDFLAVEASKGEHLKVDLVFERENPK